MTRPRFSIRTKGMILIGIPVVFQLVMLTFLFRVHASVADAERRQLRTKEVLERVNWIRFALADGHSALRALSLLEDFEFESDARARLRSVPKQTQDLRAQFVSDPEQEQRLKRFQEGLVEYLAWVDTMEALARRGAWEDYDSAFRAREGVKRLDAARAHLLSFRESEEQMESQRRTLAEQSRLRQRQFVAAAVLSTVLVAAGLMYAFTKSISQRVGVAIENARRMARNARLAAPVRGADEITELDAVLHDTARRLAEAAARERDFAAELQRRAAEQEAANQALLFRTQENETFVYSVSHDLRSPLVNLQGFTKELALSCEALVQELQRTDLPPQARQRIDDIVNADIVVSAQFIQSAVTRSANIINALLKLSRVGRVEYQMRPVDLNPIVERIVTSMRGSLQERNAEITAHPLPTVLGDATALEQALANLVVNAVNYLDPSRPGRVEIGRHGAATDDGRVTLYVRDNGLGIPAAYLTKLFVAFQRLHGDVVPGEGIGLALVKRIVDRHGGRVWADSTEGVGTVFYLTLPWAEPSAAAPDAARPGERTGTGSG